MTIIEAINKGMIELKNNNIEIPRLKARLLMQFTLNKSRQYIIVNDKNTLTETEKIKYFEKVEYVKEGIPLEYIIHQKEFMKLDFFVDENVLIPRQDTEILVEEVIKISKNENIIKILDLCTGSGAIAISLAKYIDNSQITAVDISTKALEIAKKNAIKNGVENKIKFLNSDLFMNLKEKKFDLIVTNPPYIKKSDIEYLDKEVKREPVIALDGGIDGLDFYKNIIKNSYKYLENKGYLCFEIGFDQRQEVLELLQKEGKFENSYCKKDLNNNDRVIVSKLK